MAKSIAQLIVPAAIAAVLLTSCEAGRVPTEPDLAWITLSVGGNGSGHVEVKVSRGHEDELIPIGEATGHALFPGHPFRIAIDGNAGGADFVVVRVPELYQPGPHPSVSIDTRRLGSALIPYGVIRVDFSLCPPAVDWALQAKPKMHAPCEESIPILLNAQRLEATLELLPKPGNPWFPQLLIWTSALGLVAGALTLRSASIPLLHRWTRVLAAVALILAVTCMILEILGILPRPQDISVSGRWSGWVLVLSNAEGLIPLLEMAAGVILLVASRSRVAHLRLLELLANAPPRPDAPVARGAS